MLGQNQMNDDEPSSIQHQNSRDTGKERLYPMLTSHDDGYEEPVFTSDILDPDASIAGSDPEDEDWRARSDDEEDEEMEDDEGDEMVVERPFGFGDEPKAALLDLSNPTEMPTESLNLESVSMDNILPPGTRRKRATNFSNNN